MKKIIIVLGPPGSGKGTQAKKLAAKHQYGHLSTGDLIRVLEQKDTLSDDEKEAITNMHSGHLVSDEFIYKHAFKAIEEKIKKHRGIVLDGAIRSPEQAKHFQAFFEKMGYADEVIAVDVVLSDEEAYTRLSSRRLCEKCGEIIPASFVGGKCLKCGGELIKRVDDDDKIIRERVEQQGSKSQKPIVDWYKEKKLLFPVDGSKPIEDVEKDIDELLKII